MSKQLEHKMSLARTLLVQSGFILQCKSNTSLSEYYILPNRSYVELRLSDHGRKGRARTNYETNLRPKKISLTISINMKDHFIQHQTLYAIGSYLYKSEVFKPSTESEQCRHTTNLVAPAPNQQSHGWKI